MGALIAPFAKILGAIILVVALYFGVLAWGDSRHAEGVKEEKLRWETAAEIERARQQAARAAIEEFGSKLAADITRKVADLAPILKDLADDAASEQPVPPPPPGCPDTYRGLSPGSLLKLDPIR